MYITGMVMFVALQARILYLHTKIRPITLRQSIQNADYVSTDLLAVHTVTFASISVMRYENIHFLFITNMCPYIFS
jgi:hypothetical protein